MGVEEGQVHQFRSGRAYSGDSHSLRRILPLLLRRESCQNTLRYQYHLCRAIQTPSLLSYYSLLVVAYEFTWKQGYYGPNIQTLVFNKEQIKSYHLIIFLFVELQV